MLEWIVAEKNSASDEELELIKNYFKNGDTIQQNEILFEVEGAKSIFEMHAPNPGYIYNLVSPGDKVKIGDPIGLISDQLLNELPKWKDLNQKDSQVEDLLNQRITKKAKEFALANNYDLSLLSETETITEEKVRLFFQGGNRTNNNNSEFKKCVLIGGGNGSIQLREALQNNSNTNIVGVFDDKINSLESLGIPLLGGIKKDIFQNYVQEKNTNTAFISITSNMKIRIEWHRFLMELKLMNEVAVHRNTNKAISAEIGPGCVVMDNTRLGAFSRLDENVFLSAFVDVEHHVQIGKNCTFGPGVFISGGAHIGDNCIFGSGVVIEPGIIVGDNCQIASGSVITRDIPSGSIVKLRNNIIIN
jgi:acetyltransferase-like isoleucine patch superfamily enzyme